jgi:ubiquinone/menaquinone biosynthesis C-methylase UbiE
MAGRIRRVLADTALGRELTRQLGLPRGVLGHLIGRSLARDNAQLTRWVIAQLDPGPADAVLEVGCGPAVGVDEVLLRSGGGGYDGVDPSTTMLAQARWRNRRAVETGRARFHPANAAALPFPDGRFHAAFAVNVIYFWGQPAVELREIRRVLVPDASLVVGIRPRDGIQPVFREQFEAVGHRTYTPEEVAAHLEEAGFHDITVATAQDGYAAVTGTA